MSGWDFLGVMGYQYLGYNTFFLSFSGASNNIHSIPCGILTNFSHPSPFASA
jgi:hypothetical protein